MTSPDCWKAILGVDLEAKGRGVVEKGCGLVANGFAGAEDGGVSFAGGTDEFEGCGSAEEIGSVDGDGEGEEMGVDLEAEFRGEGEKGACRGCGG